MLIEHPFQPIFDSNSKVIILGSFPSVKSREFSFYYMNKQNRFWKVLSSICNVDFTIMTVEEKKKYLLDNNIALYDVIEKCEIEGSSDKTIKNATPVSLEKILNNSNITKILLNGSKAYELFIKYFPHYINIAYKLPSTSPANAKTKIDDLIKAYQYYILK